MVHLRIEACSPSRLDDRLWGGEVRLARAEPDYRPAGPLQCLRPGVDGKGGGLRYC
jgi:hypothetical protein